MRASEYIRTLIAIQNDRSAERDNYDTTKRYSY